MSAALDRVRFAKRLQQAGFDVEETHGILEIAGDLVARVEAVEMKSDREDTDRSDTPMLLGLTALSGALAGALLLWLFI